MREGRNASSSATVTESVRSLVDETLSAWEPMFSALDDTWQAWSRGWGDPGSSSGKPHHHRKHDHGHERGCRDCGGGCSGCRDRCTCCGCGTDADVLVTTRPGERRVIPIEIRNPRHRDVTVTVDPGPWTSCDGSDVALQSVVRPAGELTIPGCTTREVLLVLEVGGKLDDPAGDYRQATGLRCCTTLTSDVRINGCGTILRVAVNVLPLDCDAVEVTCCGCCC